MKTKIRVTLITGILSVVFLVTNLTYSNDRLIDKWTSFGLGVSSAIFIAEALLLVRTMNKSSVSTN
jgi:ethanolamine transporter EutH